MSALSLSLLNKSLFSTSSHSFLFLHHYVFIYIYIAYRELLAAVNRFLYCITRSPDWLLFLRHHLGPHHHTVSHIFFLLSSFCPKVGCSRATDRFYSRRTTSCSRSYRDSRRFSLVYRMDFFSLYYILTVSPPSLI